MDLKMDKKAKRQEGASAVEFAIILPLLLILVFGIIEFSILFYDKAMITNASREGAREGIVYDYDPDGGLNHPDDAEIGATVDQYVQNHLISFGSSSVVTTTITRPGDAPGDPLTVRVAYTYDFLIFPNLASLVGGSISDGIPLDAVTVMRLE